MDGASIIRIYDWVAKVAQLKAVNVPHARLTEHIRKCVCKFQLDYTLFQFQAARYHRDFKDAFLSKSSEITESCRLLEDFLDNGLKTLCGYQVDFIQEYFTIAHRGVRKPRVGIHMVNEDDYILDIVMAPQNQDGVEKSIDDYSIFKDVKKSGTPYLDNNIPRTAKKNTEYENPSLDIQKIRHEYKCKIRDWKWASRWKNNILQNIIKDDCLDSEWAAMNIKKGDIGNIYKSHIAVPITFMDHAIKHKLDKRLADVLQLKNEGRSILGFICVDHPMTYYFEDKEADSYDNIDINVMYLFADMISLIFIISLMYKEGSDTYVTYKAI